MILSQKHFTTKVKGVEHIGYHERFRDFKLCRLKRRERYLMIYAWQHVEGIEENVLGPIYSQYGSVVIESTRILWNISERHQIKIFKT